MVTYLPAANGSTDVSMWLGKSRPLVMLVLEEAGCRNGVEVHSGGGALSKRET